MKTLETERLLLRMFRDDDLDAYHEICSDPEVMKYLGGGVSADRAETWRHMAMLVGHWHLRGFGPWAVEERATGHLLGRIGLFEPEGWPGFELGWVLGRAAWGRGYATEGARAALAFAFTELDRDHVISIIRPENAASIRVAERLGERLEREIVFKEKPALVYGISREAWRAREAGS